MGLQKPLYYKLKVHFNASSTHKFHLRKHKKILDQNHLTQSLHEVFDQSAELSGVMGSNLDCKSTVMC